MKKILFSLLLSLVMLPSSLFALELEGGDAVYLKETLNEDFYAAGALIQVDARLNGDIFAVGENLVINEAVSEDVFAAANQIQINETIEGDLRAMGQTIQLNADVNDDILATGNNLNIGSSSRVGGDLFFAGQNLRMDGTVAGDLKAGVQRAYLNGTVNGNVTLKKGTHFEFGPEARVLGDFTYSAYEAMEIPEGVVAGEVIFNQKEVHSKWENKVRNFSFYSLFATLFFGMILIALLRGAVIHNAHRAEEGVLKNMLIGFLFLVATPIAAGFLITTFIGIPLGLFVLVLWVLTLIISKIFIAMLIGKRLVKVDQKSSFLRVFGSFALGTVILSILCLIPVFGIIAVFLLLITVLGGLYGATKDRYLELKKKKLV